MRNNYVQSLLLPGLHVVDDTKVVLVSANAALDLMKEIAQLHEDNQARHGQPDVTKQLEERQERKGRLEE